MCGRVGLRERWLVDKEGYVKVQLVEQLAGMGQVVPTIVEHQGRTYYFCGVYEGTQLYGEIEEE